MAWGNKWPTSADDDIITEAKKRFHDCEQWEAQARINFEFDYKFANGDPHNNYQWDTRVLKDRQDSDKPCLTVNKTQQHNLLIINDAKQNKPGVRIRPVGDEASFEAAQIYQEVIYHIEYISSAENVYDSAYSWQVEAGIGYWRIITDYINDKTFDQEIYIRRIRDPRSVFLDMDINEQDGSDARYGFVFEDVPRDLYEVKYPLYSDIGNKSVLGNYADNNTWITKAYVRVAEYYRKTEKKDKLVAFTDPETDVQVIKKFSELNDEGKKVYAAIPKDQKQERRIITSDIEWFKIAGDQIIERGKWLGKYIPIVRLVGVETVIDGILDRKGHTRALINAQQMYNYNTSASIEFGALQTKSPWVGPTAAFENFEEVWGSANTKNHSYLPYNHIDEDGNPIPPPTRPASPQASPAYVEQLKIAQNEMMMASGQYQSQFGENENAKSGVAINARQRQGDKATYHFIDNQAIAIRFTGKILADLFPKIYDTKRIMKITARDGKKMNVTVDPKAETAYQNAGTENPNDPAKRIENIIFNPNVGIYDIQSDTGPSFATRRMDAFNALTQIAAQNKDFMGIGGDLYFKVADFPEADILSQRYERIIPPNVKGEGQDPQTEELMHKASDQIEQLTKALQDTTTKLNDKEREFGLKSQDLDLRLKEATAVQARLDYEAETKRLAALGNSGPAMTREQIQPLVKQLIIGMLNAGEPGAGDRLAEKIGDMPPPIPEVDQQAPGGEQGAEEPPMEGAEKAPDGHWYVNQNGQYHRVEMNG